MAPQASTRLVGVTQTNPQGVASFVEVDRSTGAATALFTIQLPAGARAGAIAWHGPSQTFAMTSNGTAGPELRQIDPRTRTVSAAVSIGLPAGFQQISGIAYDSSQDRLLTMVAANGSFVEERVAHIALDGSLIQLSSPLGIGDRDVLDFSAADSRMVFCDFDGGVPRVAAIDGYLGTPQITPLANPPSRSDVGDLCIDPLTNELWV